MLIAFQAKKLKYIMSFRQYAFFIYPHNTL